MEQKTHFDLSFKPTELFEEVKKITTYVAKSRIDKEGGNLLDLANMNSCDDAVFIRLLAKAESDIFDSLSGYMKSNDPDIYFNGVNYDIKESATKPIRFCFCVPESFNTYNIKYVYQLIIWAFVDSIISQWFLITNPQESAIYAKKYESGMSEIRSKLNTRTHGYVRKPSWP